MDRTGVISTEGNSEGENKNEFKFVIKLRNYWRWWTNFSQVHVYKCISFVFLFDNLSPLKFINEKKCEQWRIQHFQKVPYNLHLFPLCDGQRKVFQFGKDRTVWCLVQINDRTWEICRLKEICCAIANELFVEEEGEFPFSILPKVHPKTEACQIFKKSCQLADLRFLRRERQPLVWKGCYQTIIWPIFNDNFMKIK